MSGMFVYTWRNGRAYSTPAEVVAGELERIAEDHNGALRPEDVVVESQPQDAPLHDEFEWDDAAAGKQWRREQAADMIRALKIAYVVVGDGGEKEEREVRAYSSVRMEGEPKPAYVSIEAVVNNEDYRAQAVEECRRFLQQARRKLQELNAAETNLAADRITQALLALEEPTRTVARVDVD